MKPNTLIDEAYRATFTAGSPFDAGLRKKLSACHPFVLDEGMSAFLADLSCAAFPLDRWTGMGANKRLLDQIRRASRTPYPLTWIEYDFAAFYNRIVAAHPGYDSGDGGAPDTCRRGFLLEQHPNIETAFKVTIFTGGYANRRLSCPSPFCFMWTTEDNTLPPWEPLRLASEETDPNLEISRVIGWSAGIGFGSYNVSKGSDTPLEAGVTWGSWDIKSYFHESRRGVLTDVDVRDPQRLLEVIMDDGSSLRIIWAFLSTLNDAPVAIGDQQGSGSFFAKGKIRHYPTRRTITIKLPKEKYCSVARKAVAAVRKRAHQVRGHWRKDHWRPGERIWVRNHRRGDETLGFVTHEYSVQQEQAS